MEADIKALTLWLATGTEAAAALIIGLATVSTRAAQDLVAALKLRELSGRRRYRCWGI